MPITRTTDVDDDGTGTTGTIRDSAWKDEIYDQIDAAIDGVDATVRSVAKGGTGVATLTDKGIVYGNGTSPVGVTAVGTAGQLLTSNGAGVAPTFQTVATPGGARCKAYKTANQSIPNSAFTALTFDAEAYDVDAMHDNAVNNSRLTVPATGGGFYSMVATVTFAGNATGLRNISFKKNGATYKQSVQFVAANITQTTQCIDYITLVAGDYIEVEVFQSSGGALNVNLGEDSTSLTLVRMF